MDPATIAAARRGDREAQARLLRELQDPWFGFCLSLLQDRERAMDATQETALRFLRQLSRFRGESQLRTWSLGIALNVVREMRRSTRPTEALDETSASWHEAPERSPGEEAERAEERANLQNVLEELPMRQREAVVLRFFEELSTEQTADVMQCAIGTVKATLHQALRTLREKLMMIVL